MTELTYKSTKPRLNATEAAMVVLCTALFGGAILGMTWSIHDGQFILAAVNFVLMLIFLHGLCSWATEPERRVQEEALEAITVWLQEGMVRAHPFAPPEGVYWMDAHGRLHLVEERP